MVKAATDSEVAGEAVAEAGTVRLAVRVATPPVGEDREAAAMVCIRCERPPLTRPPQAAAAAAATEPAAVAPGPASTQEATATQATAAEAGVRCVAADTHSEATDRMAVSRVCLFLD